MNKTSKYLELLSPPDDKYNSEDYILAMANLADDIVDPIPGCMYTEIVRGQNEDGTPNAVSVPRLDVVRVLYWVMCVRENSDITLEEVGRGVNGDNLRQVTLEILYFWSSATWEEVLATIPGEDESGDSVEKADDGNPTEPEMESEPLDLE